MLRYCKALLRPNSQGAGLDYPQIRCGHIARQLEAHGGALFQLHSPGEGLSYSWPRHQRLLQLLAHINTELEVRLGALFPLHSPGEEQD